MIWKKELFCGHENVLECHKINSIYIVIVTLIGMQI